jgi:hypothetical protein
VQPFTPTVELLRNVLVGTPLPQPFWVELLRVGAFALALVPVAVVGLRLALRIARRNGTLMEY